MYFFKHDAFRHDRGRRVPHRMVQAEVDEDPSAAAESPAAAALSPAGATPGQPRQAQCWPSGICACTDATWRPQPAHVGLPQVPHFTW